MIEYNDKVLNILMNFQYIEEGLKMYVTSVNKRIKEKMKNEFPFKYERSWVEDDSLGKLIKKFEKINNNNELIKELKSLRPLRNEIAHKILLLTPEQRNDQLFKSIMVSDLDKIKKRTKDAFYQVLKEIKDET